MRPAADPGKPVYPFAAAPQATRFEERSMPSLLEKGIVTPMGDERKAIYTEVQRILAEEKPWVPLVYLVSGQLGSSRLEGVNPRANGGMYDFRKISFKK